VAVIGRRWLFRGGRKNLIVPCYWKKDCSTFCHLAIETRKPPWTQNNAIIRDTQAVLDRQPFLELKTEIGIFSFYNYSRSKPLP